MKKSDVLGIFKRLLGYMIKNYKFSFLLVVICILITAVATMRGMLFVQSLVDDYIVPLMQSASPDFSLLAKALLWSVWDSVAFSPSSPIWPAVSSMACSCLAETWDPPLPAVRSAPTAASPWHLERPSAPTVARS